MLFFVMLFLSCTENSKKSGSIEVRNGITYVTNPETGVWGNSGTITLEKMLTIESDQQSEEVVLASIYDVCVDDSGRIYVCDFRDNAIKVFSKEGQFLHSIGGFGSGPGELAGPMNISLGNKNQLYVLEAVNARVSVFRQDGTFNYSFAHKLSNVIGMESDPATGGVFLLQHNPSYHPKDKSVMPIHIYDQQGKPYSSFGTRVSLGRHALGTEYALSFLSHDDNRGLLHIFTYPYRILRYSWSGQLAQQIEAQCPFFRKPVLVSSNGYETFVTRGAVENAFVLPDMRILTRIVDRGESVVDDLKERFRSLRVSGNPTYIQTTWRYYYDLFDAKGRFLKRFPEPVSNQILKYVDHVGYAYFVNKQSELPGLTKYRLSFVKK